MFYYFPDQYTWSAQFVMGLWAGGQFGEMHRWLDGLREGDRSEAAWERVWNGMARQQEDLAADDLKSGYRRSAGSRYLRATVYRFCGERQMPPGPAKTASYAAAMDSFAKAKEYMPLPIERVEIPSPDGVLPAYLIPAKTKGPAPTVIFYSGFDVVKEMLYCFIREEFAQRGISVIIVDTPGLGEPLRLRNVPSRPDYEVPTKAVVDYLETRLDVDKSRIGIMGISLGGYYAPRGAAFEPRIKAVVAWGAIYDYGAIWQKRWASKSKYLSVPFFQLPWVMGTKTMEEALERVKAFTLADVLPKLKQPILIMHGENDISCPLEEASKTLANVGSTDKTLRIFTIAEGGAEHVQADEPDAARQLAADWFAQKLGASEALETVRGVLPMKRVIDGVYVVPMGNANAFLIEDEDGLTLVDAGDPHKEAAVFEAISRLGRRPDELKHLILTHGHSDHIGSAAAIVQKTGARTYMHPLDIPLAESGGPFRPMSPAPGLLRQVMCRLFYDHNKRVAPVVIDQPLRDGEILPIAGGFQIIHVPGHCAGQVALLWRQGRMLFAADVCMNLMGLGDPIGFESLEDGRASQRRLASLSFDAAGFGHGNPIASDASTRFRNKWSKTSTA